MSVNPGIIVDTSELSGNLAVFPFGVNPWQGPVKYGSNLWIAAVNGFGSAATPYWYKSSDGGMSWSAIDTADAPAIKRPFSYAYPWGGGATWYFSRAKNNPSGGKITADLEVYSFNMSTGLWNTTPVTTMSEFGQLITISGNPSALICLRATQPNFVLFYGPDTPNQLSAQVYDGASWSGPYRATGVTPLPPNSLPYTLRSATVDNSNIVHLVFTHGASKIAYISFDPTGGTFGSVTDIYTTTLGGAAHAQTSLVFKPDTDELIFPIKESSGSPLFHGFKILRGTPTSGPSWTVETKDLESFFPRADYSIRDAWSTLISVDEDYSTLYIAFTTINDNTELEQKLWYISNSGSGWSDPVLVWDISNNPPQNFPGTWMTPASDGTFGGLVASNGDLYFTDYGLYTLSSPAETICGIITFISITSAVRSARCIIGHASLDRAGGNRCYIG